MEKEQFEKNIRKVYDLSLKFNKGMKEYFVSLKDKGEKRDFIVNFLEEQGMEVNEESVLAASMRLVFLKKTHLEQFMKKNNYSQEKIDEVNKKSYEWVRNFYEKNFEEFISKVESENLLTEFYLEILKGVHKIGLELDKLQPKWLSKLEETNACLENDFKKKEEIISFLKKENLFDKGHSNEYSERSYSILVKEKGEYKVKTYPELFPDEIERIINELKSLKEKLSSLEDNIYNQKQNYINYIDSLISAFLEKDRNKLILTWSEVDKAWMKITTLFQINHLFEDYEDPYRNTVSIEWDLRLPNLKIKGSKRIKSIQEFYDNFFENFGKEKYKKIYEQSKDNLNRVQFYLGKPVLYYADRLNGLFSAQVIPNDENVSKGYGKKIFAFPDLVLIDEQSSPFMLLPKKVYEQDVVKYFRNFIHNEEEKWKEIYDISTVGHECGHILWKDEETESKMNASGDFQNIEEFKASATSLTAFFLNEKEDIKKDLIYYTLSRAVSIIAGMEITDRKPYYCESLLTLDPLFESGILNFDGDKLKININEETYKKFKENFLEMYKDLVSHYLNKKDASEFLFKYVQEESKNYLPKKKYIRDFIEYYYKLYKEFGNQTDKEDPKENYIKE
jgi:hypothetical protein